jgi:membrane protease YdiL (CAAX protease family)
MRAFMTKHRVSAYILLTFTISWGGALLVIGGSGGMRGTTPTSDPRFMYALMAMLAGPSLSGILCTALVQGHSGIGEFLLRLRTWRVDATWYAVAVLTAPILMIATLLALASTSPAFLPGIIFSEDRASLLLVSLAVGLPAGVFEELGWTGFAVPAVRERHSVLVTGLIVGLWWSAWHLLPNIWSSQAAAGELTMSSYLTATAISILVGYLTAFRVLMVWVYDRTKSLLVGMVMHASFTTSLLILNPLGIAGADLIAYSFALAGAVWVVVAAVVVTNRSELVRQPLRRRVA